MVFLSERRRLPWLLEPLNTLPRHLRWTLVGVMAAATAALAGLDQRGMGSPFGQPDAAFYVAMARGDRSALHQPFASRPLAPLVAHLLAVAGHVSVETGFVILGWVSLLFTLATVFALASRTASPRWVLGALSVVAFWPQLLRGLALPDLPYAALMACLLWCLTLEQPVAAALMLFPLMLARESTFLVLLCLLGVAWRRLRLSGCVLAIAASVLASALVRHLTAGSGLNVEHLPAGLYLLAKVPWNLLRTLGIDPWSNLYPYLCATPLRVFSVHLGPLQSVGLCRVSTLGPTFAAAALLTTFGVLPVLCLAIIGRGMWARADLLARFCIVYGGMSFILAPALGTAQARLFGYAWPLWLVALPALLPATEGVAAIDQRFRRFSRSGATASLWILILIAQALLLRLADVFPTAGILMGELGIWIAVGLLSRSRLGWPRPRSVAG